MDNINNELLNLDSSENLVILDENNQAICTINTIKNMPFYSEKISSDGLAQIQNLLSESFKGVVNIPNKSLEIFFKPEIAKGLNNGTYNLMKTKQGEILADAINVNTNKIVGKARVKTNLPKQISTAGFQILSFAVAQAHLEDINLHLNKIENLCRDIIISKRDEDIGNLKGEIEYLKDMISEIRDFSNPETLLSDGQKNNLENIINGFSKTKSKFTEKFNSLIKKIENQRNIDKFGTENTYLELKSKLDEYNYLLKELELITRLYIMIKMITGYTDPLSKFFTSTKSIENFFNDINKLQDKFIQLVPDVINNLLKATFNVQGTLDVRRESLLLSLQIHHQRFNTINDSRKEVLNRLDNQLSKLSNTNKGIRYALRFNANGEVVEASLV